MHYNKLLPTLFLALINSLVLAQGVGIGQWRDHLPYNNAKTLTEAGDRIYCASEEGLFYYSKTETTVDKLSKINGLSDIGFSTINYDSLTNTLVIAYTNTNIDLIQDTRIINIPDIKRKIIPGNKIINKIFFKDSYAYLACGFGIVVIDLIKKEIKDTYYIGPNGDNINVTDITSDGNEFYASTAGGIYHASVNAPNLANYNFWTKYNNLPPTAQDVSTYSAIEFHAGKVYTNIQVTGNDNDTMYVWDGSNWNYFDTVGHPDIKSITSRYNNMAVCRNYNLTVYDATGTNVLVIYEYFGFGSSGPRPSEAFAKSINDVWIADAGQGLVHNTDIWNFTNIHPNGPRFATAFDMSVENSNLWVASGGVSSSWAPQFKSTGIGSYINNNWNTVYPSAVTGDALTDIIRVAVNPVNPEKVYAGAWVNGMAEITNSSQSQAYDSSNSTLDIVGPYTRVGGFDFDADGNLWVGNSNVTSPISVLKTNGTWKNFSPPNFNPQNLVGDLIIDSYNQKWLLMPYGKGLLVFNDNYTIDVTTDDKYKYINTSSGSGALPHIFVHSIAEDLDGEIWVGTDKGIAVFYSPGEVFCSNPPCNFDAQQILIEQDGYAQYLFETEIVSAIAVDGGNRKWIGTQNAGVFLMSPDGTEELLHFTEDNSPLFSNNIYSIAIDDITGEVFIGTDKGIISYKGTATEGGEVFNDVYAYPNPVHSDYDGPIAIKGLVKDADVKITDVSGNLVYATTANGGQAVWNGKKFDGEKVATGVYLVFASNEDGSQTHVTKILVVN